MPLQNISFARINKSAPFTRRAKHPENYIDSRARARMCIAMAAYALGLSCEYFLKMLKIRRLVFMWARVHRSSRFSSFPFFLFIVLFAHAARSQRYPREICSLLGKQDSNLMNNGTARVANDAHAERRSSRIQGSMDLSIVTSYNRIGDVCRGKSVLLSKIDVSPGKFSRK